MTKKYKINLLDLFSGIGGFHLGLERAGFKINSYFSEIDKYAIDVYKHNFKNSTYVKSVTDVRGNKLPRIDAITFGSPCQDFSIAGKGKGMAGERSSLIIEAIRLIQECRPRFFIWENVKGTFSSNNRQDFAAILQAFTNIGGYRLEWQLLNTKWFLPQNRERIYLVGYTPGQSRGQIFPISKVVESFVEKGRGNRFIDVYNKKYRNESPALTNPCHNNIRLRVETCGDATNEIDIVGDTNKEGQRGRIHSTKGIVSALSATDFKQPKQIAAKRGRNLDNPSDRRKGIEFNQRLEINKEGVSNTLTSVQKDNYVIGDYRNDEGYRQRANGDAPCLSSRRHSEKDISTMPPIVNSIRRLTPIECERLQGFPDNWTKQGVSSSISDSQRYKMCGNAVTVDVVEAVGKRIKKLLYD